MSNRLKNATSPYLLQHQENPVDWYEWGPEAFERAAREDKPIFLSVGYAACHWCHVMAHESFEDDATASIMNEHFVNIKLDREERPDVDAIYMDAVVAMTGHGGWPMSVFLTPEAKPFYGGTYFPLVRRGSMPSFKEVLESVARAWREDRPQLERTGVQLTERIASSIARFEARDSLDLSALNAAAERMFGSYDWSNGGWGGAPKFPQATSIEFLFQFHQRTAEALPRDMAVHALRSMAGGGIYDQIGGGFHRYAVDGRWRVPHFEKMLYDNALLAKVYLIGWQVTGEDDFRRIAEQTLDFLLREMSHPQGGVFSSLDADSEGEEGKFYVWTLDEIQGILADRTSSAMFQRAYGLTEGGNFEGTNVLFRAVDPDAIATEFDATTADVELRLREAREKLLAAREDRVRPALDDKVVAAWNGLALGSLAQAGRVLSREDYLSAAQRLGDFLLEHLVLENVVLRTWRDEKPGHPAFLEDHAALGEGLLALYQADFNPKWFLAARRQADEILAHFRDPQGGFFDTREDHEGLIARPKSVQDTPTPSGNSLAASLLLRLGALTGDADYVEAAETAVGAMQAIAAKYPTAFAGWLNAIDFALGPQLQLALIGPRGSPDFEALYDVVRTQYLPRMVVAGAEDQSAVEPALLADKTTIEDRPTAYLCEHFACQMPTSSAETLRDQISQAS